MFNTLPQQFRSHGLAADVRTLLLLRKAMQKGLIKTLGDLYALLKGIVVKDPEDIGPFTKAYYAYFLDITINPGESLEDAVLRSETFRKWRKDHIDETDMDMPLTPEELAGRFLDEVHLTNYDIKEIISGKDILDQDDADMPDEDEDADNQRITETDLQKMADYSDISLEELMERLEKVRDQQRTKHQGGSHWIGTGGISPFGHGGAAKNGIRVGGTGGGKMARKVMGDKNFFPVDKDALLNDNNVDAALASIKGVIEESAIEKLDIPFTIKTGLQRGGLFLPEMKSENFEELKIIVLIDNGGYSMSPYIRTVQELFRKMKTRFAHDLEVFYFHNTIYNVVYKDEKRIKRLPIERLLDYHKMYRVFIIGDAAMAPYELNAVSFKSLKDIKGKFKKTVWLNPEPLQYWPHTYTIQAIKQLIPMFPLTPHGIERAVREMNSKNAN
ncbi:MAG: hypothetical protein WBA74_12370 [Cyclobacteriaceae bacterium]